MKDIAALAGVTEAQLTRVIRLTATAGFLCEPQPGQVAHTSLSAHFVRDPSFLDAALFTAGVAAPAALEAGCGASGPQGTGEKAGQGQWKQGNPNPKLRRQRAAFISHAGGIVPSKDVIDILGQLQWPNLSFHTGSVTVVELCHNVRDALAPELARHHPDLSFLVQLSGPPDATNGLPSGIGVSSRGAGELQSVADAAVYILHLGQHGAILSELRAHFEPLRQGAILLVLTTRLLPERGGPAGLRVEAVARSRDLVLRHLREEGEMELVDLVEQVGRVYDSKGKLVVAKKLLSANHLTVALVVSYQSHAEAGT